MCARVHVIPGDCSLVASASRDLASPLLCIPALQAPQERVTEAEDAGKRDQRSIAIPTVDSLSPTSLPLDRSSPSLSLSASTPGLSLPPRNPYPDRHARTQTHSLALTSSCSISGE